MLYLGVKHLDIEVSDEYLYDKVMEKIMKPPPFRPAGLDHVVLRVADAARAREFYETVLGCRLERHQEDIGLWQLRAGAALIDLVNIDGVVGKRGGAAPRTEGRNVDHVAIAIRPFERDALRAHLAAHRVAIEGGSDDNYGAEGPSPALYIRDPDGNMIELMGRGSGATGAAVA
jgi:catechol 2,3-dioxygenase-like lactoylglutathione lyase family enzyme